MSKSINAWPARGFYHYFNAYSGEKRLVRVIRWIRINDEFQEGKTDEWAYIAECDSDQGTGFEDFDGNDLSSNHLIAEQSSFYPCDDGLYGLGTMTQCDTLDLFLSTEGLDVEHKPNLTQTHQTIWRK